MKNAITAFVLTIGLLFSGAAMADAAKAVKPAKPNVDTMTTQAIGDTADCNGLGAKVKYAAACNTANISRYPENALSGMNLGF